MDGFVILKIVVAELSEFVFGEFGTVVVIGAVEPVLCVPVPGLVITLLEGSGAGSIDANVPKLKVGDFVVD